MGICIYVEVKPSFCSLKFKYPKLTCAYKLLFLKNEKLLCFFFFVADENREDIACFLVNNGASVDVTRREGPGGRGGALAKEKQTPLHMCCSWGLVETAKALLQNMAKINAQVLDMISFLIFLSLFFFKSKTKKKCFLFVVLKVLFFCLLIVFVLIIVKLL